MFNFVNLINFVIFYQNLRNYSTFINEYSKFFVEFKIFLNLISIIISINIHIKAKIFKLNFIKLLD
jgi:hypothetical protein